MPFEPRFSIGILGDIWGGFGEVLKHSSFGIFGEVLKNTSNLWDDFFE